MSMYFDEQTECACKCCGKLPENGMDPNLMDLADALRRRFGPLTANCAYRCPEHNAEVGGEIDSQHLYGTAMDIDASEYGVEAIASAAEELGADGVGRYSPSQGNFVHIDTRSGRIGDTYRWGKSED